MRRKSNRSTSKTSSEKAETSSRKSRRHSKRHKKSSSQSSSEESDDLNVATIAKSTNVQDEKKDILPDQDELVKKVTSPASTSNEIQQIMFNVSRQSPEKNETLNKSTNQIVEDIGNSEEKVSKKTRGNLSSTIVEAQEDESDEQENKRGKGKSKTKHRSKSEKTPHIQDVEDQSQSEISENVQVTPQSPQAAIDIRLDTESTRAIEHERVSADDEMEVQCIHKNSNNGDRCDDSVIGNGGSAVVRTSESCLGENKSHTPPSKIIDPVNIQNSGFVDSHEDFKGFDLSTQEMEREIGKEATSEVIHDTEQKTAKENIFDDLSITEQHKIEKLPKDKKNIKGDNLVSVENKSRREHTPETSENYRQMSALNKTESENIRQETDQREKEKQGEEMECDNENTIPTETVEPADRLDENYQPMDISTDTICTPNKSLNLTRSFSPEVKELIAENMKLQSLKAEMCDILQTSVEPKFQEHSKWGDSLISLKLMKPFLYIIDINTIKSFVPDLRFLDESEVRLDLHERRRSYLLETIEKRADRKVSVEGKSDDGDFRRLDTQSSVNSSEMEETIEIEIDNSNIIAMNRKISIVDDTASKLRPPPSPSRHPISEVLYITNLVRPFTLKQLKELLERTGKMKENGFWTDRIKSKCYVNYETTEEAEATRNALHGVNWPIGNGKKLIIDYATEKDLEKARNPEPPKPPIPVVPAAPVLSEPKVPENKIQDNDVAPKRNKPENHEKVVREREKRRSEAHIREWDIGKENMHKRHSRSKERDDRNSRNIRRRHRRTPSPIDDFISKKQRKKEEDIPQKLMDDLFRKTKATPSIYWLPLTPEEIATKQQQRLLRMAEHKRRMEESSRSRGDYGRGAPYRRRYD